jgi:hypothetical protein
VATHATIGGRTQRGLAAAALTALVVAAFEAVSFYKGAYPGWWIGLLGAPPAIALTLYKSTRTRLLAWLLLSLLGALVSVAVDVALWFA